MANDCLVINLESEIDDENLPVLGALECEIVFTGTPTDEVMAFRLGTIGDGCPIEILDNGNFYSGFAGTVTGKTATKTGAWDQNPVYLKPEVFTRPLKLRIKNAFSNILSFGDPNGDWNPVRNIFARESGVYSGWILILPTDIQYAAGLTGLNAGFTINGLNRVDFSKLPALRTILLNNGIMMDNVEFNLSLPPSISRLYLGGILSPVESRKVNFDINSLKSLIVFDSTNTNITLGYSGTGTILSTGIIDYWTQNNPFAAGNTAGFDLYLQALSLCTFNATVTVRVAGTRTSASDTAVATLVSKRPGRFYINGVLQS